MANIDGESDLTPKVDYKNPANNAISFNLPMASKLFGRKDISKASQSKDTADEYTNSPITKIT